MSVVQRGKSNFAFTDNIIFNDFEITEDDLNKKLNINTNGDTIMSFDTSKNVVVEGQLSLSGGINKIQDNDDTTSVEINNETIIFSTNSQERMRISNTGLINMNTNDIVQCGQVTGSSISFTTISGFIQTPNQTLITSVGTLSSLNMGGNIDLNTNDIIDVGNLDVGGTLDVTGQTNFYNELRINSADGNIGGIIKTSDESGASNKLVLYNNRGNGGINFNTIKNSSEYISMAVLDDGIGVDINGSLNVYGDGTLTGLTISVDNQTETLPGLLIQPTATTSQDAVIRLQGARNSSTTSEHCQIVLSNYDNDLTSSNLLGKINGEVTNGTSNIGDIVIYSSSDGTSTTEAMRISSTNDTSILGTLINTRVEAQQTTNRYAIYQNTNATDSYTFLEMDGSSSSGRMNYGAGTHRWRTGSTNASIGTATMELDSSGNLGIGNLTPGYKLDVNGDINFTGSLYQNGVSILGIYADIDLDELPAIDLVVDTLTLMPLNYTTSTTGTPGLLTYNRLFNSNTGFNDNNVQSSTGIPAAMYRLQPTIAGIYHVIYTVELSGSVDEEIFLHLYKNGSQVRRIVNQANINGGPTTVQLVDYQECNANDYFEFYITQNNGLNLTVNINFGNIKCKLVN